MKLSLVRMKQAFPYFNEIAVTEMDFWRVAKKEGIIVRSIPLAVDGYYERFRGRDYIILNDRLSGLSFLHTALHEISHYFLDVPCETEGRVLFRGKGVDARERVADAIALIGLLPFPDLIKLRQEDLSDNPWLCNLVRDRIAIFVEYGV